jgi:hypothetical protein
MGHYHCVYGSQFRNQILESAHARCEGPFFVQNGVVKREKYHIS